MKHAKALAALMAAFLMMALSACGSSESDTQDSPATPAYEVSVHVECDDNLIFSRYDVLVYFDGTKLGELDHGKTADYSTKTTKGQHKIEFRSKDDSSTTGSVTVDVDGDCAFSYTIHCTSDEVKIKELDGEDSGGSTESQAAEPATPEPSSSVDASKPSEEPAVSDEPDVLTADNCPELAAILATHNESDPAIGSFAAKYNGRTIEFDGCITYWSHHESYKTRFDFLLGAGNYDPDTQLGPNFKFDNVNRFDLGLPSSADGLNIGDNVRVRAEVGKYNADTTLFLLKPITVTPR